MFTEKLIDMKTYTQEEFDNLRVAMGVKMCPPGDYSAIKYFGALCSFGKGCKFGEGCKFGKGCKFGEGCSFGEGCRFGIGCRFEGKYVALSKKPFVSFTGFGSRNNSTTYVWNFKEPLVRCGCQLLTVEGFKKRVLEEGGDPLYIDAVDLMVKKLKTL